MSLATLLRPDLVFRLRAASKEAALAELARRAAAKLGLVAADIAEAVTGRERLGSTGVGAGIALPHARLAGLAAPAALFARLERAVDWQSVDGRPVDLAFFLLSPSDADAGHLAALAAVTRRLREPGVAAALRAAPDPPALLAALLGG